MSIHTSTARDNELSDLAYAAVKYVPTVEPNDRNRLGYHIWLYLRGEIPTIESAVKQARSRFSPRNLPMEDVVLHVENQLRKLQSGEVAISPEGDIMSSK
jgi:hypothetical protein